MSKVALQVFRVVVFAPWIRSVDSSIEAMSSKDNLTLLRCPQQGETRNTQTRRYFKIIVFNDNIKGRQGKVDTPGITSRPDKMEFNKQDLNTHSEITHTWTQIN